MGWIRAPTLHTTILFTPRLTLGRAILAHIDVTSGCTTNGVDALPNHCREMADATLALPVSNSVPQVILFIPTCCGAMLVIVAIVVFCAARTKPRGKVFARGWPGIVHVRVFKDLLGRHGLRFRCQVSIPRYWLCPMQTSEMIVVGQPSFCTVLCAERPAGNWLWLGVLDVLLLLVSIVFDLSTGLVFLGSSTMKSSPIIKVIKTAEVSEPRRRKYFCAGSRIVAGISFIDFHAASVAAPALDCACTIGT
mmetsp:Transcript_96600/g.191470  ORF Transcript_96600/g.191470 Transcript_96600/m.191470 type:complete len:250 (+) Transcript_96600:119-868(+)